MHHDNEVAAPVYLSNVNRLQHAATAASIGNQCLPSATKEPCVARHARSSSSSLVSSIYTVSLVVTSSLMITHPWYPHGASFYDTHGSSQYPKDVLHRLVLFVLTRSHPSSSPVRYSFELSICSSTSEVILSAMSLQYPQMKSTRLVDTVQHMTKQVTP